MDVCSCDKDSKIMEEPQSKKNTFKKSDNGDFLTKKVLEYIVNYDQTKVNACLKISVYGEVCGFLVRNAFIKYTT
jgi:hypothetical protein